MKPDNNLNTPKLNDLFKTISLAEVKLPKITPSQVKNSKEEWIKYGDTNQFPNYLIDSVIKSTTHQSFIEKRQELIKSEGLTYSDDIASFLDSIDEDFNTINDLLDKVSVDLSVLETFAVAVRYNQLRKKIIALDYIDSSYVRPSKTLDSNGSPNGFWVSADWNNIRDNVPVFYEAFNPNKVSSTTQLAFYYKKSLGQPFIPQVSYTSAMNFVELENELSRFALNTVHNGFFASAVLSIKGSFDEEQRQQITREVKNHFAGAENASQLMVSVSEEENPVTVTPLSTTDNTPLLNALNQLAISKIATAHKGNPIIAGITPDGSSLGSDGKLYRESLEIYYNTVIRNLQNPFIKFIKKVLKFNGYNDDYELDITSSALLVSAMDVDIAYEILKPEVFASMHGHPKEDLKPELLVEEPEAPLVPEVNPEEPDAIQ